MTQEAFERFFKYADLKRFKNDTHALAYLRQIARHRLLTDYARTASERISGFATLEACTAGYISEGTTPTVALICRVQAEKLGCHQQRT